MTNRYLEKIAAAQGQRSSGGYASTMAAAGGATVGDFVGHRASKQVETAIQGRGAANSRKIANAVAGREGLPGWREAYRKSIAKYDRGTLASRVLLRATGAALGAGVGLGLANTARSSKEEVAK